MTAVETAGSTTRPVTVARPRWMLWTALGLLAVFVALALGVAASPDAPWTQALDDLWRGLVGVGPDSWVPAFALAQLFQHLGQLPGAVLMMILLPSALALVGRWRSALFVIVVQLAGPGLLSQLTKNLVDRPRPVEDTVAGLFGPLVQVDHGSFPSGHSVSMGAIVITVLALIPASAVWTRRVWILLGVLLGLGMVWQRTLINAHWFTDTCAGLIGGAAVAVLLWWAFLPWLRRDHERRAWFLRKGDAAQPTR